MRVILSTETILFIETQNILSFIPLKKHCRSYSHGSPDLPSFLPY